MANLYDPNQNNQYGNAYPSQGGQYGQGQYGQYGQNQYGQGQYGAAYDQGQNPQQMYQQQMYQQQGARGAWGAQQPIYAPGEQAQGQAAIDVNIVLVRSFVFMFMALLITGITALMTANSVKSGGALAQLVYGSRYGFIIFLVLEIGIVIGANVAMKKNNLVVSAILFLLYSVINGLTLSVIFLAYTTASITQVFFIAAGIFGVMAFLGAVTKMDLSKLGTILLIGLFGIIIATIVNMFIGSSGLDTIISVIGVVIFVGLTAYDVQKIKVLAANNNGYDLNVLGLYGAMELYLDFINLFLYLLRLFGKTNN